MQFSIQSSDGVHVAARLLGAATGKRLVVMQPAGSCSGWWEQEQLDALTSAGWQVLSWDLRDSGLSGFGSRGAPGWNVETIARDLLELLDHLEWPSVTVMGVSFGAVIAERFALLAPERCSSLLLVAPLQADLGGQARVTLRPQPAAISKRNGFGAAILLPEAACRRYLVAYARASSGPMFDVGRAERAAARMVARSGDLLTQLVNPFDVQAAAHQTFPEAVRCPVLVVQGQHDPLLSLTTTSGWAARVPLAQLLVLSDAGHGEFPDTSWSVVVDGLQMLKLREADRVV